MRILKNVLYMMLLWLFASFLMIIPRFIIGGVLYPSLEEWFPRVFVEINPIKNPVEFARHELIMNMVFALFVILMISYLCVRFDNERMEYMIRRTEGMYLLPEGAAVYYPRYVAADLTVALAVPLPQLIGSLFLPERIPDFLAPIVDFVFDFTYVFTDTLGYVLGYLVIVLAIFLSRLCFGITSLSSWRGVWLSEI